LPFGEELQENQANGGSTGGGQGSFGSLDQEICSTKDEDASFKVPMAKPISANTDERKKKW
jgi:hypothetical protein